MIRLALVLLFVVGCSAQTPDQITNRPPPPSDALIQATALWRPADVATVTRMAKSWDELESLRDQLAPRQLVDIEHVPGGSDVWAGIWRTAPRLRHRGAPYRLLTFPPADLETRVATQRVQDFELVDIEIIAGVDGPVTVGLFHPRAAPHRAVVNVSRRELTTRNRSFEAEGWRIIDVEVWIDEEQRRRWAAVWRQDPSLRTMFWIYEDTDAFGAGGVESAGWLPRDLEVVMPKVGPPTIAGVWERASEGSDWWEIADWSGIENTETKLENGEIGISTTARWSMIDIDLVSYIPAGVFPPGTTPTHGIPLDHSGPTLPPPPPPP
ncbi:MAG: hypothetical protein AAGD38_01110 [Acidobacteriota bacterium]